MLYRPGASLSEQYIADFVTNKLAAGFVSVCCYRSVMRSFIARKSYSRVVGNQSHMQAIQPFLQSRKSGTAQKIMVARLGGIGKSVDSLL